MFVVQEVGHVDRPFDLFSEESDDPRVVVAQGINSYACKQIQVSLVVPVDQVRAAAPFDEDVVPAVGLQQILLF